MHSRFVLEVGTFNWYDDVLHWVKLEQILSVVVVCSVLGYCDEAQTVSGTHSRFVVDVGADVSYCNDVHEIVIPQ